jgi:hypothetical protein
MNIFFLCFLICISAQASEAPIECIAKILDIRTIQLSYPRIKMLGISGLGLSTSHKYFCNGDKVCIIATQNVIDELKAKKYIEKIPQIRRSEKGKNEMDAIVNYLVFKYQ